MSVFMVKGANTFLLLTLLLPLIAGCTQYWAKPGGTPSQFETDKAECNALAYRQFPPNVVSNTTYTQGYKAPDQTNCTFIGNTMNCTSQPSMFNVPPKPVTTSKDINIEARNSAWRSCMYSKGYQQTSATAQHSQAGNGLSSEKFQQVINQTKKDRTELCQREEFKPIILKSSCYPDDFTLEQLADKSRITEIEKPLLSKFYSEQVAINRRVADAYRSYGDATGQRLAMTIERAEGQANQNATDLFEGKIGWGDFNKRRKEITTDHRDEFNKVTQP